MYPLHPFTVHFPIALLLAHGLFTWLHLRRGEQSFETSAYHCLIVGWFGALAAVLTGVWAAWQQIYGAATPRDSALLNLVNAHAIVGIAILLIAGQMLLLRRRQPGLLADTQARRGYLRLLIIGVLLVLLDGWLGGQLASSTGSGAGS